ncbi:threonine aldolase family protein [Enemella evansiae]|uniref:threonine aldolase family protein n=1 Tax=Enemella evansiae TaxID=2016499 RepID=UPI000B96BB56|nr:GntG family PLP-dependent aldolase [Enemella evansiae]OYO18272.1 low specificity L-threonine aldolase [Enemella evansiae]TDO93802.1 L-threonine aldolase [Enemella evansiae]
MIDLRSDTLTVPDEAMRQAMAAAPVGDDVYAEDPTIEALERRTAELLGHQAGLFCATGSLSNVLGVAMLVRPGQEVLCDRDAHIARAELGAHGAYTGVTMRTWPSVRGITDLPTIESMLAPDAGPYLVSTAAVALENTHNFGGGSIQPLDHLQAVHQLCRDAGVRLHLDGARLWNAHIATGTPLADYGRLFDTVSVCFSKGLGAPVGSMLLADTDTIARARVMRKRLGGGWRQAGLLAAAADHALSNNLARMADDHTAARALAEAVAERAPQAVDLTTVQTNIVVLGTGATPATEIAAKAAEADIRVSALGPRMVRAVTWNGISVDQARSAGEQLGTLLADRDPE